jgi:hypothetical protein
MTSRHIFLFRRGPTMTLLALLMGVSLLGTACGGDEAEPTAGGDGQVVDVSPSPGTEGLLDDEATPSPGTETPEPAEEPTEEGTPPPPGEPTSAGYEVEGQGTDPTNDQFLPTVLLATNPTEGAAVADASPAPGAAALVRDWNQYAQRSLVVVLGGSQPDPSYRVLIRAVNVIKGGTLLLAFGKLARERDAAAAVVSVPWIVLSIDAEAADTVTKCTLSLKAVTPFTTDCPSSTT